MQEDLSDMSTDEKSNRLEVSRELAGHGLRAPDEIGSHSRVLKDCNSRMIRAE